MTRIDYYVLAGASDGGVQRLACRIANKAYSLGNRVYLHTDSSAEAKQLDTLLWTFSDDSFVPHSLAEEADTEAAIKLHPVLVGYSEMPDAPAQLLINLAAAVPAFFDRFERVAEVVDGDEQRRAAGRTRYRFYRDKGYDITTHKIGG